MKRTHKKHQTKILEGQILPSLKKKKKRFSPTILTFPFFFSILKTSTVYGEPVKLKFVRKKKHRFPAKFLEQTCEYLEISAKPANQAGSEDVSCLKAWKIRKFRKKYWEKGGYAVRVPPHCSKIANQGHRKLIFL